MHTLDCPAVVQIDSYRTRVQHVQLNESSCFSEEVKNADIGLKYG